MEISIYEKVTTLIAVAAFAQPWVIQLCRKFFKKAKITFIPSGKIKLFYNRSGAYVQIGGVVESKNQPVVIKDISAKIIRECDRAELKMNWHSFTLPVYQNVAGNIVTTSEMARPFKVQADDLSSVFVEFANVDASYLDQLSELHNTLIAAAKTIAAPTMPLEKAREDFKKTAQYQSVKELLLESFYWKVSSYILQISICYGESSVEKFSYKFSLDESEITEFKRDIETAMECAMDNQYGQSPAFYYPLKDYVETRNTYANT